MVVCRVYNGKYVHVVLGFFQDASDPNHEKHFKMFRPKGAIGAEQAK